MSVLPSGPIREVVIDCPVHQGCIGDLIEVAAQRVLAREILRCLCLDCLPDQFKLEAWHMHWAAIVEWERSG